MNLADVCSRYLSSWWPECLTLTPSISCLFSLHRNNHFSKCVVFCRIYRFVGHKCFQTHWPVGVFEISNHLTRLSVENCASRKMENWEDVGEKGERKIKEIKSWFHRSVIFRCILLAYMISIFYLFILLSSLPLSPSIPDCISGTKTKSISKINSFLF